jgi:hypothetical protein
MADIFISYSKADRTLVLRLSTYLEAEGWKVWWDKSLSAGDEFRDEIMKQIASARAVIVVWTENSVNSKWVRAEAGVADRSKKLIPTKSPSLPHDEIPLPFGEQHTENLEDLEIVRAAVVAQLAKPAITQTELEWNYAAIRNELIKWTAIVSGSLSLYTHAGAALGFAQVVRPFIEQWTVLVHAVWAYPLSLVHVRVPLAVSLACTLLISMLGISISERRRTGEGTFDASRKEKGRLAARLRKRYEGVNKKRGERLISKLDKRYRKQRNSAVWPLIPPLAIFSAMILWPVHDQVLTFVAKHNRGIYIQLFKIAIFGLPLAMLHVGPARPIIRRLWFVVIGAMLLAALSELAKLSTGEPNVLAWVSRWALDWWRDSQRSAS